MLRQTTIYAICQAGDRPSDLNWKQRRFAIHMALRQAFNSRIYLQGEHYEGWLAYAIGLASN